MRVGIYSRYLATLGGGEKYTLTIAACLAKTHKVAILTHDSICRESIERRFDLDLSDVSFENVELRPLNEMSAVSANYDLFINASDNTFFPSTGSRSVLIVYFPVALRMFEARSSRWRLKVAFRHWLKLPLPLDGLHATECIDRQINWRIAPDARLQLPKTRNSYQLRLTLLLEGQHKQIIGLFLDDEKQKEVTLLPGRVIHCVIIVPTTDGSNPPILQFRRMQHLSYGGDLIRIVGLDLDIPQFRYYKLLGQLLGNRFLGVLHSELPKSWVVDIVDSYDSIWSISRFTQRWVKRYWNRDSEVLYPPINSEDYSIGDKRNQIINVGRFFDGRHNKKHLVMIEAFKAMVDEDSQGWELILVGGTMPGERNRRYLIQLEEAIKGYPISIHKNVSFDCLIDLYSRSKIYWHATGYGEDESHRPIKSEHFGITTVEAMASGCVPVVINRGGQPEIVNHCKNGFLWETIDELQAQTNKLIRSPGLLDEMSKQSIQDSRFFDETHFCNQLSNWLSQV